MFDLASAKVRFWLGLVVALVLVAAFVGYGEWRADSAEAAANQRWELATEKLNVKAANDLARETREVLRLERALTYTLQKLEEQSNANLAQSKEYERRLAAAAAAGGGRLRDPNAECGRGGRGAQGQDPGAAGRGAPDGTEAGGLLSTQLTGLLQQLTREADAINVAYAACRADTLNLRATMNIEGPAEDGEQLSPPQPP